MLFAADLMPCAFYLVHRKGNLFSYWNFRLQKLFARKKNGKQKMDSKKNDDLASKVDDKELYVERIRLETMELRFALFFHLLSCHNPYPFLSQFQLCSLRNLIGKVTIQEPTFEEVIVLYR